MDFFLPLILLGMVVVILAAKKNMLKLSQEKRDMIVSWAYWGLVVTAVVVLILLVIK